MLLNILSDWSNSGENSEEENVQEEEFIDWYIILEVSPEATTKEIKKQYRNLAKQYHPDTAIDEKQKHEFEDKMRLINQAWAILRDEDKRKEFDERRKTYKG
jgi:curved DNA-binding protein CbpA